MKTIASTIALPILVLLTVSLPVATAGVVTNISIPLDPFTLLVPCALGGSGELVALTGSLHILATSTVDAAGGIHLSLQSQPQGAGGFGLTSGDMYRGTGVTRMELTLVAGAQTTFVNNFNIIGVGTGNNLLIHDTVTITANADGTITQAHAVTSAECK